MSQLDLLAPVAHCSNCDPRLDAKNMKILMGCSIAHLKSVLATIDANPTMDLSSCTANEIPGELWHLQHRHSLFRAALRRRIAGEKVKTKTDAQERARRVLCRGGCGKKVHRQGEDAGRPMCASCQKKRRKSA